MAGIYLVEIFLVEIYHVRIYLCGILLLETEGAGIRIGEKLETDPKEVILKVNTLYKTD